MDLLQISDENKSHYVCIKDVKICIRDLSAIKENIKIKNTFVNIVFSVRLKSGSIKFRNYQKKLGVPLKSYADFECTVRKVKSSDKSSDRVDNDSYTEKYQDYIPCSFAYKVPCVDDKFSKPVVLYRGKIPVYKFINAILKE